MSAGEKRGELRRRAVSPSPLERPPHLHARFPVLDVVGSALDDDSGAEELPHQLLEDRPPHELRVCRIRVSAHQHNRNLRDLLSAALSLLPAPDGSDLEEAPPLPHLVAGRLLSALTRAVFAVAV